jgi:hypothetical protein
MKNVGNMRQKRKQYQYCRLNVQRNKIQFESTVANLKKEKKKG